MEEDPWLLLQLEHHLKTTMHYPNVSDLKFIYQTNLTASDVKDAQSRLAIPRNQILTPFLTQSEDLSLQWKTSDGKNTKIALNVVVGRERYELFLSRWNYYDPHKQQLRINGNTNNSSNTNNNDDNNSSNNNNNNNRSKKRKRRNNTGNEDNKANKENKKKTYRWKYVVNGDWNKLKSENHLESGDLIRVASFRYDNHKIGFVILHTPHHHLPDLNIIPAY